MYSWICIEIVSAWLSAREDNHIECSSIDGIYRCIRDDTDQVGTCNRTGKKSGQNYLDIGSSEYVNYCQTLNFFKTLSHRHENFCHVFLPIFQNLTIVSQNK